MYDDPSIQEEIKNHYFSFEIIKVDSEEVMIKTKIEYTNEEMILHIDEVLVEILKYLK